MSTLGTRGADASHRIDSETVLGIDSLDLRARIVVEGFLSGLHRSPYHGFSSEFSEYRPYVQGDDLRYLDWKLLARTDRRYLKRFEDETNLRCHLIVDLSRSMSFGHERSPKADYAVTLAATLARFLGMIENIDDNFGLLMRKLAVNGTGALAVVNSTFKRGKTSRIWLIRGQAASGGPCGDREDEQEPAGADGR